MVAAKQEEAVFSDEYNFVDRLVSEGAYEPGDCGESHKDIDLSWIDPDLIAEGQKFVKRNLSSVCMAYFFGNLSGSAFRTIEGTIMRTGAIYTTERLFRSLVYFLQWLEKDILDKVGRGAQDILKVRKLHLSIADRLSKSPVDLPVFPPLTESDTKLFQALKRDLAEVAQRIHLPDETIMSYTPAVFMSQMDMAIIQFTTAGICIAQPEKFGITEAEAGSKGFQGFIQLTAVAGKMMGMSDRWNICLEKDIPAPAVFERMWADLALTTYAKLDELSFSSVKLAFSSLLRWCPFSIHLVFFVLIHWVFELKGAETYSTLSKWERLWSRLTIWLLNLHKKSGVLRSLTYYVTRCVIWILSKHYGISS